MAQGPNNAWLRLQDASLDALMATSTGGLSANLIPHAARIQNGVPVYDCAALRAALTDGSTSAHALMAEWIAVWQDGAGIVVLKHAFPDAAVIDRTSDLFMSLIHAERQHQTGGDHFAQQGANDRVWNALEKHCLADPELFARYYQNDMIALVSLAWLGPAYQITAQVNNVRPGGSPQSPHRDYHLGFCTPAQAQTYPAHVHQFSPMLTLQGAIAHVDMPLESGPTLYLPHSQKFKHGYLIAQHPEFKAYFEAKHTQLPLEKGDAVFFNPALIHAAGRNTSSNIQRLANLLQISSPFGRAMESVNRTQMACALYPALQQLQASGELDLEALQRVIAASAEGYPFPTNLDLDPPLGGLAPSSQQDLFKQALQAQWPTAQFESALHEQAGKKHP